MTAVIVVGSAAVDEQIVEGQPPRLQLGGVVTYGGAGFAKGGLAPIAVCNLDGRWATRARAVLKGLGVPVCAGRTDAMTSFRNRVLADGEREQHLLSVARPIEAELVERALKHLPNPHIHLGPLHSQDISERERCARLNARAIIASSNVIHEKGMGMAKTVSVAQLGHGGASRAIREAQKQPVLVSKENRPAAWILSAERMAEVAALHGHESAMAYERALELIAVELYREATLTLGQAAKLAGIPLSDFIDLCGRLHAPILWEPDQGLDAELDAIAAMAGDFEPGS